MREAEFVDRLSDVLRVYNERMRQLESIGLDLFDIDNVSRDSLSERLTVLRVLGNSVCSLVGQLPQDVRAGGFLFSQLAPAIFTHAQQVRSGNQAEADPVHCPPDARAEHFAAALAIGARWSDIAVAGERAGTPVVAMPDQDVRSVIDNYYHYGAPACPAG